MPQDGDSRYEESFNSFLAGVFLTRRSINNFEFFSYMNSFVNLYNVDIASIGNDICVPIYFDDIEIKMIKNMDDVICINNRNITVREYLYSLTTARVREFFKIPDVRSNHTIFSQRFKPLVRALLKRKVSTSI